MSSGGDPVSSGTDPQKTAAWTSSLHKLCAGDADFCKRYDINTWKPLGKGSFADVVQLYCRLRQKDVAVKIFRPRSEEDPRRRIPDECFNSAVSKRHVLVYSPHENAAGDLVWLEMELLGPSLQQEIAKRNEENRPFTMEEALAIALDAGEAVKDAHDAGVIHRDVKPGNFLFPLSGPYLVKLSDFGISKMREHEITGTGEFPGTPEFAAPEVADDGNVTRASDIYSLGHTFFRLITGQAAISWPTSATMVQVLRAQKHGKRRLAKELRSDVSDGVTALLTRMISPKPESRPPIDEILDIIRSERRRLDDAKAQAAPPKPSTSFALGKWKKPAAVAAVALVLLVAIMARGRSSSTAQSATATPIVPPPPGPKTQSIVPVAAAPAAAQSSTPFRVRRTADGIWFENPTSKTLATVQLALLDAGGARYVTRQSNVEPGETWLMTDDFAPKPPTEAKLQRAEVTVGSEASVMVDIGS